MDDLADMTRMPSLPLDPTLLDILRVDHDILDLDGLEWALEDGLAEVQHPHHLPPPQQDQQKHLGGGLLPGGAGIPELSSGSGADFTVPMGWPAMPLQQPASNGGAWSGPMGDIGGASGSEGQTGGWGDTTDQRPGRGLATASGTSSAVGQEGAGKVGQQRATSRSRSRAPREQSEDGRDGAAQAKKKRMRNSEQMAQNRVAQAKYRERKKAEAEELAGAVETLTAQLAAMKAIEARTMELEGANRVLASQVTAQAARISSLELQTSAAQAEAVAARAEAEEARRTVAAQHAMILDQHTRLRLQEDVVEALRGRLKERVEAAFGSRDPKQVCARMCDAVRAALAGASNVEGLQHALDQLPEHMIVDICHAILCEVRAMWPELSERLAAMPGCRPCPPRTTQQQETCNPCKC